MCWLQTHPAAAAIQLLRDILLQPTPGQGRVWEQMFVVLCHVQGFCHRRSALVVPPALWGGMGVASMNTHLDPPLEKGYRELLIVLLECAGPRFRCCLFTAYWELLNSKSPLCGTATRIVGLGFKVKNINIRDSDMHIYSVITNNLQRQEQNQFINNNPSWQKCT